MRAFDRTRRFWLSTTLRIDPSCGVSVPDWMPAWATVVLLVLAAPGWLGMFLVDWVNGQVLPDMPVALVSQFLMYFGLGHLVALAIRKIGSRQMRPQER